MALNAGLHHTLLGSRPRSGVPTRSVLKWRCPTGTRQITQGDQLLKAMEKKEGDRCLRSWSKLRMARERTLRFL